MGEGIDRWFTDAVQLTGLNMEGITWEWAPPERELLDPSREVGPMILMNRAGYRSLRGTIRSTGYEPDAILKEIDEERRWLKERGIILTTDAGLTSNAGVTQARQGATGFPDPANDPAND